MLVNRAVALGVGPAACMAAAFMACVGVLSFSGGYMLDLDAGAILAWADGTA